MYTQGHEEVFAKLLCYQQLQK